MSDFVWTAATGWIAVLLFGATFCLPYLLRRAKRPSPYLRRLWPHYWTAYLVVIGAFGHAWLAMRSGHMRGLNMAGLWAATIAVLLLLWQVGLGLTLRDPALSGRRAVKRIHFWSMGVIAALLVTHIVLNEP